MDRPVDNAETMDPDGIDRYVERGLAGELSPSEQRELDEAVRVSASARRAFWESISLQSGLRRLEGGRQELEYALETPLTDVGLELPAANASRPWSALATSAFAVTLAASLLVAALIGYWPTQTDRAAGAASISEGAPTAAAESVIGTLKRLSADGRWSFGDLGGQSREQFHPGDTLWLERGAAELTLANGVVAQLEAPLVFKLLSVDHAQVLRGRVTIDVPQGAEGFRVVTAAAEVIDLGTTFSVDVGEAGGTDVVVFQGKVDVQPAPGAEQSDRQRERLLTGEALHVGDDGTLSRIVNVRRQNFAGPSVDPIVSEVRDNIVRGETRKYYEIVAGGMTEDVPAFVDRRHQWNGLTDEGLPPYLLSGDYVKTFNDDKVTERLQITVAFDRPATLYLLVDDRLEQRDWLSERFEDTGDDVGMDEAPRVKVDSRTLEKQAGQSIDQVHSVWKLRRVATDTVTIGPMGPVIAGADELGVKSKLNMYGIVAVAIDTPKAAE